MMTTRTELPSKDIVDLGVNADPTWHPIPLGGIETALWGETLAAQIVTDASNQRTLSTQLTSLQVRLAGIGNPRVSCAVWIPYPESGRASCALGFELIDIGPGLSSEAAAAAHLKELQADEGRRSPGTEYLGVTTWTGEVEAGPFVAAHNFIARRDLGDAEATIEERTVFAVFPPGAAQYVQFVFSAEGLGAFVNMPRETEEVVASLQIELEETA